MIKLSTGATVPEIKDLTQKQRKVRPNNEINKL